MIFDANRNSNFTIVDRNGGNSHESLSVLEEALKILSIRQNKGDPLKIYEVRKPNIAHNGSSDSTLISFILDSPSFRAFIGESFWVPNDKDYLELNDHEGGTGTAAYKKAIGLMHRYLTSHPRSIIKPEQVIHIDNGILSIDRVVEENESHSSQIFKDSGLLDEWYGVKPFNFIVLDVETNYVRKSETPIFLLGSTWDLHHGLRQWSEDQPLELAHECARYDRVVTFNGFDFDLQRVLSPFDKSKVDEMRYERSIDLYHAIRHARAEQVQYRKQGELHLSNLAFATLGKCKYEVAYEPDSHTRSQEIDGGLVDHCVRDVELTRDLFFYMLEHKRVYNITFNAMMSGNMVNPIYIHKSLEKMMKEPASFYAKDITR